MNIHIEGDIIALNVLNVVTIKVGCLQVTKTNSKFCEAFEFIAYVMYFRLFVKLVTLSTVVIEFEVETFHIHAYI